MISTGTLHSDARSPVIERNLDHAEDRWSCHLACQSDLLAAVLIDDAYTEHDHILIWN
jgi:hypothetical protein